VAAATGLSGNGSPRPFAFVFLLVFLALYLLERLVLVV